jgi:hypothetical protein
MQDFENIISRVTQQNADEKAKSEPSKPENRKFTEEQRKEYGKMMAEKRQYCYDLIAQGYRSLAVNVDAMRDFLHVESRFEKKSVNNNLLIMMQNPEATELKTSKEWEKAGGKVVENLDKVFILESSHFTKGDVKRVGFNIKELIDISDVKDVQPAYRKTYKDYGENSMIVAVLDNCSVPIERTEQNLGDLPAIYDEKDNKIYYNRCSDFPKIFTALAKARAHVEMKRSNQEYRAFDYEFHARCAAYIVAEKYGVDTKDVEIFGIPQKFAELDEKALKAELEKLHNGAKDVLAIMLNYFEKDKEKGGKETRAKKETQREDR